MLKVLAAVLAVLSAVISITIYTTTLPDVQKQAADNAEEIQKLGGTVADNAAAIETLETNTKIILDYRLFQEIEENGDRPVDEYYGDFTCFYAINIEKDKEYYIEYTADGYIGYLLYDHTTGSSLVGDDNTSNNKIEYISIVNNICRGVSYSDDFNHSINSVDNLDRNNDIVLYILNDTQDFILKINVY